MISLNSRDQYFLPCSMDEGGQKGVIAQLIALRKDEILIKEAEKNIIKIMEDMSNQKIHLFLGNNSIREKAEALVNSIK